MRIFPPRSILVLVLAVGLVAVLSCRDDEVVPTCDPCPPPNGGFQNLTEREHVLNNFELAYNKRNISEYDEILDVNFTFFLTPGDVGGGLPEQWGRAEELLYNQRMFDPNYAGGPRMKSVQVNLQWGTNLQWVEFPSPTVPTENWYATTVFYNFKFEMEPDITYISNAGAKGQFTVRNAGTDVAPRWQLVEFRDLGDSQILRAIGETQPSTFGQVKAIYR